MNLPFSDRMRPTLAILSQVYVPDPASVGQHLHDVAVEMVRRGYRVVVLTANCGYEDPTRRYPARECLDGVDILRLPLSSFGKTSIAVRMAGGSVFLAQAIAVAASLPRLDYVLVTTSPPIGPLAGSLLHRLRGVSYTFWAMDLNPDQIVATGRFEPTALPVRAFDWLNRSVLRSAHRVVALDRFMAERLCRKLDVRDKLAIVPPWPHVDASQPLTAAAGRRFRNQHGLEGCRVVMYSGNLSPVHPVATVLEAARRLRDERRLMFVFVGAGLGRAAIEEFVVEHALTNVRTLPYQQLSELEESLSAADVHLVSMGDPMVGIVHPCKIYGAMAVARPILALGPRGSHVAEIVRAHGIGWHVEHGDVDSMLRALGEIAQCDAPRLEALGARARKAVVDEFSKAQLRRRFCDVLQQPARSNDAAASDPPRVSV